MKTLRFVLATVAALGSVSVFATNARVESMGKNPTFIMDDISIFDNPANINLYPNFLIGELGTYVKDVPSGVNEDPNDPWFGGIFSLGIGENKALSIAGVFNRKDEIRMMKLVGASQSFIRGPFLVEAILYGLIAAVITFGLIYGGFSLALQVLVKDVDIAAAANNTHTWLNSNWPLSLASLAVAGIIIGILSSALATRKYLRKI